MNDCLAKFNHWAQFPNRFSTYLWWGLFLSLVPVTLYLRTYYLSNALIEPHPWRQSQTALTIYYFFHNGINLFDYSSPLDGKLWRFVFEFPLYQAIVSFVMKNRHPAGSGFPAREPFFLRAWQRCFCLAGPQSVRDACGNLVLPFLSRLSFQRNFLSRVHDRFYRPVFHAL